jgi:hypothetical protein
VPASSSLVCAEGRAGVLGKGRFGRSPLLRLEAKDNVLRDSAAAELEKLEHLLRRSGRGLAESN